MDIATNIAYAVQVCDVRNRENIQRICGDNRTILSKKSIKSFLNSVEVCATKHKNTLHKIAFFNDNSSDELLDFIKQQINLNKYSNIFLEIINVEQSGIVSSILSCYRWMQDNGKDFVYLIQDDYIFFSNAITELLEMQCQLKSEVNEYALITPFNDNRYWNTIYKNIVTPRAFFCGKYRYWIQIYDISCSFLIHINEFNKHWDLYYEFLKLIEYKEANLESKSLNYILVRRGVLALAPVNTLAFHVQSEFEEDPYIKWQPLWESINV